MTSWQDEPTGSPFGRGGTDPAGRPLSRREAREAERRAAETMLEKPPHPSGVVDFEAHDFSDEFTPDQDFAVGDTQDIWRALTRGAGQGGAGATPAEPAAMPETMDRVREALLRRRAQTGPVDPVRAPEARPAAFEAAAFPAAAFEPQPVADQSVSRRELRRRLAAEQREDGLPSELFDERAAASAPQPAVPPQPDFDEYAEYEQQYAAQRGQGQGQYDDGYFDQPYAPEPTIAIPVRDAAPQQAAEADPVALPHGFREPVGDDALTFSSPTPQVRAEAYSAYAEADTDPAFIEPEETWEEEAPVAFVRPKPASAPIPFLEPQQSAFGAAQMGPPSELTDLAGFEALIRKARQQPGAQPSAQPAPSLAWADDEEVQEGFGSLLSRQVQSSHGTSPALILPNDPQPADLTQAVSGTGDIFVTGSMKLSNRFSSTGVSEEHYDSHDIDRLYDASQDEPATGVAPVRASKAVSGASHDRVMSGKPGRANVVPTVLAVVAGAMAVGLVVLLVGSWMSGLF